MNYITGALGGETDSDPLSCSWLFWKTQMDSDMSNDQYSGWLGYIGDYTTQLYRGYKKPI